jgi:transcriptional regulator with XRE-family HTH domain
MALEKETFGPVLRASRERNGVTLEQIASETKLAVELWAGLEEGDFSQWPKQLYARSYVRDYAIRVGLDPNEIVNEFCRLFPEWGDRRAERLIRRQAAIINHDLDWEDLPTKQQRRASDRLAPPTFYGRHRVQIFAAVFDLGIPIAYTWSGVLLGFHFWPSLAIAAVGYNAITSWSTRGFGVRIAEWLIRMLDSMPSARRRLMASRTQSA